MLIMGLSIYHFGKLLIVSYRIRQYIFIYLYIYIYIFLYRVYIIGDKCVVFNRT